MQTQDSPRGPSINSVPPDGWSGQAAGPAGSDRLGQPLAAGPEAAQPGRGQVAATAAASPAPSVADLDMLYKETDRLYVELSRGSGLSACAYWVMYAIEVGGGTVTQRQIIDRIYYPKQTVNSAVRSLEGKGLLVLAAADADRRSKLVTPHRGGPRVCPPAPRPGHAGRGAGVRESRAREGRPARGASPASTHGPSTPR